MNSGYHVVSVDSGTPTNPQIIFDGDCSFCRTWIEYWKQLTGDRVSYAPYQQVASSFPQIPRENFAKAVQLVLPDGKVMSGARAALKTLEYGGKPSLLWIYETLPGASAAFETVYGVVARNRSTCMKLTQLFFGLEIRPLQYELIQGLFLKLLGLIYLIAFASFGWQVLGLIGSRGILPASQYLHRAFELFGSRAYTILPSVLWLGSSDFALRAVCGLGMVCSLLIVLGVLRRAALAAALVLYLSLVSAGQVFMSYQWDVLLIEAGFLAIFLGYSQAVVWLFRWLLFRLTFLSGCVKLLSGDPVWRDLTALAYHFQSQPIPTPPAWYWHQLPLWMLRLCTSGVFFIEILVPLFFFAPKRLRYAAGFLAILLQVLILSTGNYAFFNLLALALCLFLYDDAAIARYLPRFVLGKGQGQLATRSAGYRRVTATVLATVVLVTSFSEMVNTFFPRLPLPAGALVEFLAPFDIVNTYGLFAVMTKVRNEIVVEGSDDGNTWLAYEFRDKPGDVRRAPPWVAPHQPRLDWQMWFAALSSYAQNPWFVQFVKRLLEGSPEVLALIAKNPFPNHPPRFIRAAVYQYSFTKPGKRARGGAWWDREFLGYYLRPVSLEDLSEIH